MKAPTGFQHSYAVGDEVVVSAGTGRSIVRSRASQLHRVGRVVRVTATRVHVQLEGDAEPSAFTARGIEVGFSTYSARMILLDRSPEMIAATREKYTQAVLSGKLLTFPWHRLPLDVLREIERTAIAALRDAKAEATR